LFAAHGLSLKVYHYLLGFIAGCITDKEFCVIALTTFQQYFMGYVRLVR